jgi:hypothetical protein
MKLGLIVLYILAIGGVFVIFDAISKGNIFKTLWLLFCLFVIIITIIAGHKSGKNKR